MKRHLFAGLAALTLVGAPAQADEILEFDSPDRGATDSLDPTTDAAKLQDSLKRLEVPAQAAQIPIQMAEPSEALPPAPVLTAIAPASSLAPLEPTAAATASPEIPTSFVTPVTSNAPSLELSFELPPTRPDLDRSPSKNVEMAQVQPPETRPPAESTANLDEFFQGGGDSLVAVAIGSAEGTRTPEGDRTDAYGGHVDPGNQVWNQGSFSYQHEARSPEEADAKQLKRLQQQAAELQQQAATKKMVMTAEEWLNALDLANQAPAAALERGGYLDWLEQAYAIGLRDGDAILWARVRSFLDPDTRQWNAPGLGNTIHSISQDQERRMGEIRKAIAAQTGNRPSQLPQTSIAESPQAVRTNKNSLMDRILNFSL